MRTHNPIQNQLRRRHLNSSCLHHARHPRNNIPRRLYPRIRNLMTRNRTRRTRGSHQSQVQTIPPRPTVNLNVTSTMHTRHMRANQHTIARHNVNSHHVLLTNVSRLIPRPIVSGQRTTIRAINIILNNRAPQQNRVNRFRVNSLSDDQAVSSNVNSSETHAGRSRTSSSG